MQVPRLYTPQNIQRAKYAQIGAAVVALVLCGYLAFITLAALREVWQARSELAKDKADAAALSREASALRTRRLKQRPVSAGGVDSFAVRFAVLARSRHIALESVEPEGSPIPAEISIGDARLGVWNACKVRVTGQGKFPSVVDLVHEFRNPAMLVRLESFDFQSSGSRGELVKFNLLVTVYESKSESS